MELIPKLLLKIAHIIGIKIGENAINQQAHTPYAETFTNKKLVF